MKKNNIFRLALFLTIALVISVSPVFAQLSDAEADTLAFKVFCQIVELPHPSPDSVSGLIPNEYNTLISVVTFDLVEGLTKKLRAYHDPKTDLKSTLMRLNTLWGKIADKYAGNGDGDPDLKEIQNMYQVVKNHPGLRVLLEKFEPLF